MSEKIAGATGATPIIHDPRLANMDPAQVMAYLREVSRCGGLPQVPVTYIGQPSSPASAADKAVIPPGVFNPDVSLRPEEISKSGRFEWVDMPGGGKVCVHPVALEEITWLNRQAIREVRGLGLMNDKLTGAEAQVQANEAGIEAQLRGQVWQAIACCRVGESISDAKVFRPEHAPMLRTAPGYSEVIKQICEVSDSLSTGRSESAMLLDLITGFFGQMGNWLEMWSLELNEETMPTFKETLEDFGASVLSITQHGKLFPTAIQALFHCLIPPVTMTSLGEEAPTEDGGPV